MTALFTLAALVIGFAQYPSGLGQDVRSAANAIAYGIYPSEDVGSCCWMGPNAALRLTPPAGASTLIVIFSVPNYAPFTRRTETLTLRAGGGALQTRCCYAVGQHAALFSLGRYRAGSAILVKLAASFSFVPRDLGMNQDTRHLSVLIRGFDYRNDSGSLLLTSGSAVAQSVPMTRSLMAWFAFVFVLTLVMAWFRPIYAIVILILLEPFGSNVTAGLTTITYFKTALVGTVLGFAPRAPWKELWQRREALVPIACIAGLMVAALLSIVHAVYPILVFREALKYFEYAVIFAVSFLAYRIARDRAVAGIGFELVAIAVCCAALAQEGGGTTQTAYVFGHIVPRIAGPLEGPNQLAGWLELMVPVLLCVRLQQGFRFLGTLAVVLAIVTSTLTLSRAGVLGLVVGIAVFAFASQRAEGRRVTPIAIIAAFAAIATLAYRALPQGPAADTFNNGLGTRSQLWHAAVGFWKSHPLTGIGAGNYETQLGRAGLVGIRTHANSWYLQSLAEGGLIMFAAVLATIYGFVVTFIRSRALLANAALAATAAICVHQIFDDLIFFPKVGAMWFLIAGVGAAVVSGTTASQRK